jgi:hypothetical protein
MKWLQWDSGRQDSGYLKILLATSRRLKFDCYILKFPDGVGIPPHTDPSVEGYEHHRLNIFLNKPCIGTGIVSINGPFKQWLSGRIQLFRPDLYTHSMTPAEQMWSNQSLYILSIGWLKKVPT